MPQAYISRVVDRAAWRRVRPLVWALCAAAAFGAACSEDEPDAGQCVGGVGAVEGAATLHCDAAQPIGECVTGAVEEEEHADAGADEHEHEEEEHAIQSGREADDDDCKYRVRFENTCVAVNQPVTFTLTLTRKFDGMPGAGTNPAYPEIYLADEVTHLSPSNNITARESSPGTYEIGPVIFDRSGRWVVRFHYFETCSEIPEDSPHGHVAFYFDVPAAGAAPASPAAAPY